MSTPPGSADRPASAAPVAPRESVLDGADAATLRRLFHLTSTFLSIRVALTGYGQAEDRRRALDAGFDRHLTKPVDPAALREVMQGAPAGPPR